MTLLPLVRALVCWLAVGGHKGGGVTAESNLRGTSETNEGCTRCDIIVTMLKTGSSGELVQHIDMVERGQGASVVIRKLPLDHLLVHASNYK